MRGKIYRVTYADRRAAGAALAAEVQELLGQPRDALVLALPRGGVPVGLEVARALHAPLDVFVVRKLGAPGHEEYGVGAIATGGVQVLNERAVAELQISRHELATIVARESAELRRREELYRGARPPPVLRDRTVVLVDDGLATGFTMRAAIAAARAQVPARLVVAVPVGARETCDGLASEVDAFVCPLQPDDFAAVGLWYDDFSATTDDEVRACLAAAPSHSEKSE